MQYISQVSTFIVPNLGDDSSCNRPFDGFFNSWHRQVKENPSTPLERASLNLNTAKFESHLLKTSQDIAPQSREKFIDICMVGGGDKLALPPTTTTIYLKYIFEFVWYKTTWRYLRWTSRVFLEVSLISWSYEKDVMAVSSVVRIRLQAKSVVQIGTLFHS